MQLVCAAELEQEGTAGLRPNLQVGKEKNLGKKPTPAAQSRGEPGQRLPAPCLNPVAAPLVLAETPGTKPPLPPLWGGHRKRSP